MRSSNASGAPEVPLPALLYALLVDDRSPNDDRASAYRPLAAGESALVSAVKEVRVRLRRPDEPELGPDEPEQHSDLVLPPICTRRS